MAHEIWKSTQITPGIEDEAFIRDQVPMTKEEVRCISICKLHLQKDSVVYDVGSGTGSIAVELSLCSPDMRVYAIETNPAAVELIRKNRDKFACENMKIIEAMAPEGFEALPTPTHAFIGGSKGNLREILEGLYQKNPSLRVVMNAVSMESICQMQGLLKELPVKDVEILELQVSKSRELGSYHMLQANNPVFIFAFSFTEVK